MNLSPRVIRMLLQAFPLAFLASFAFTTQNLEPNYFAVKVSPFLEDIRKAGQGKAKLSALFSNPKDPYWYRRDIKTISKLISYRADPTIWTQEKIQDISLYILFMSHLHNLPPELVLSLIEVESNFNPLAISNKGAKGLMQLMPATASELAARKGLDWHGPTTLEDPKRNIELAIHYLVELRQRFRRPDLILVAYNLGPNALNRRIRKGDNIPMVFYQKVISTMKFYQSQASAPLTASAEGKMRWL